MIDTACPTQRDTIHPVSVHQERELPHARAFGGVDRMWRVAYDVVFDWDEGSFRHDLLNVDCGDML
jgi:hypothetical protein